METAVDKLEAMFQKAEADIEYVEKRLKFDFMTNARDNGTVEGNPVQLLESLAAIKARHAALCAQMEDIAAEQKRSVDSIRSHLNSTVKLVEELQSTAEVEVPPLTEEEQEARESLCSSVSALSVQVLSEAPGQEESTFGARSEEVSEEEFESVPRAVRGHLKRGDVNLLYGQLVDHFSSGSSRGALSQQKMKKLNMKASDSALRTLQHLSRIHLDKKGHVTLPSRD